MYIIMLPLEKFRRLTIPYYDEDNWNRHYAYLTPPFLVIFTFFVLDAWTLEVGGFPVIIGFLLLSLAACILIWCTTKVSVVPEYNMILIYISFLMSILWIVFICDQLVDLLGLIGEVSKLPTTLLGLTLLSWGNSTGDMYANIAIAKLGMAPTALTA